MTKATMTLSEVAEALGVSVKTVRRLIAGGHLRGTFIGRKVLVRPADLDAYLEAASAPRRLDDLR